MSSSDAPQPNSVDRVQSNWQQLLPLLTTPLKFFGLVLLLVGPPLATLALNSSDELVRRIAIGGLVGIPAVVSVLVACLKALEIFTGRRGPDRDSPAQTLLGLRGGGLRAYATVTVAATACLLKTLEFLTRHLSHSDSAQLLAEVLSALTTLLLAGLILWLLYSLDDRQRREEIASQLNRIEAGFQNSEHTARIAASGALLAMILGHVDRTRQLAHCHAGGLTLKPLLLDVLPQTATGFYNMLRGNQDELRLREHHIVDTFLENLVQALPHGSVWLGITRLQNLAGWQKDNATGAYYEFQRIAELRTRRRELAYFRLWGFDDEKHQRQMVRTMRRQQKAKFCVRYCVKKDLEDISMIWVPLSPRRQAKIKDANAPIEEIEQCEEYEPLCAIKFHQRGGRELDEMVICSPRSDTFRDVSRLFRENWPKAKSLPEDCDGGD